MHITSISYTSSRWLSMYLPEDFPDRVSVLAVGCCGGVQRLCWAAYIIHADRSIIAAQR